MRGVYGMRAVKDQEKRQSNNSKYDDSVRGVLVFRARSLSWAQVALMLQPT